jgi:Protein of unknown function (DUF3303)
MFPGLDAHFRRRGSGARSLAAPRVHPTCDEARTCARGLAGGTRAEKWESTMKFMLTFSLKPDTKVRDEAIGRFKATSDRPPKGAKLLGRWTAADFSGGFDLLESDDVRALTEFSLMWSDLMELKIVPVIEDSELGEVLNRSRK